MLSYTQVQPGTRLRTGGKRRVGAWVGEKVVEANWRRLARPSPFPVHRSARLAHRFFFLLFPPVVCFSLLATEPCPMLSQVLRPQTFKTLRTTYHCPLKKDHYFSPVFFVYPPTPGPIWGQNLSACTGNCSAIYIPTLNRGREGPISELENHRF